MIKILIADDNPVMRNFIFQIVKKMGSYDVSVAKNGLEAYQKYAGHHILIIDQEMPGMTGLEVLQKHHDLLEKNNTYVMMITTDVDNTIIQSAKQLKIHELLVKPLDMTRFNECIMKFIAAIFASRRKNGPVLKEGDPSDSLKIDIVRKNDMDIMVMDGDFTNSNKSVFSKSLKEIEEGSSKKIVIDMSKVSKIDAYGYGTLVVINGMMKLMERDMFMSGCDYELNKRMDALGIYKFVPYVHSSITSRRN